MSVRPCFHSGLSSFSLPLFCSHKFISPWDDHRSHSEWVFCSIAAYDWVWFLQTLAHTSFLTFNYLFWLTFHQWGKYLRSQITKGRDSQPRGSSWYWSKSLNLRLTARQHAKQYLGKLLTSWWLRHRVEQNKASIPQAFFKAYFQGHKLSRYAQLPKGSMTLQQTHDED